MRYPLLLVGIALLVAAWAGTDPAMAGSPGSYGATQELLTQTGNPLIEEVCNTVSVSADEGDPNPGNNIATSCVDVIPTGGQVCNTVSVSADEGDPNPGNNIATFCVDVTPTGGQVCNTVSVFGRRRRPQPGEQQRHLLCRRDSYRGSGLQHGQRFG